MFNDKPKEGGDKPKINLPKPEIQTDYGTFGLGRAQGKPGVTWKKTVWAEGGAVKSASKRADGCAIKGKTRGKMV